MTNEEKFKTVDERFEACVEFLKNHKEYDKVPYVEAVLRWLALEAEEEKPEPCPFCGGKCVCANEWNGMFRVVCHEKENCWYSSSLYDTRSAAIAAHNRVVRAVSEAKEGANNA